jgi:hypothetical protein
MKVNSPENDIPTQSATIGRVAEALTGLVVGAGGASVEALCLAQSNATGNLAARVIETAQEYPASLAGPIAMAIGVGMTLHAVFRH